MGPSQFISSLLSRKHCEQCTDLYSVLYAGAMRTWSCWECVLSSAPPSKGCKAKVKWSDNFWIEIGEELSIGYKPG